MDAKASVVCACYLFVLRLGVVVHLAICVCFNCNISVVLCLLLIVLLLNEFHELFFFPSFPISLYCRLISLVIFSKLPFQYNLLYFHFQVRLFLLEFVILRYSLPFPSLVSCVFSSNEDLTHSYISLLLLSFSSFFGFVFSFIHFVSCFPSFMSSLPLCPFSLFFHPFTDFRLILLSIFFSRIIFHSSNLLSFFLAQNTFHPLYFLFLPLVI